MLIPVLLFEGPLDNMIVQMLDDDVATGHYIVPGEDGEMVDYELGQLYYHDHGKMHFTWVGRPAGTKPSIKLALDVASLLLKLLRQ